MEVILRVVGRTATPWICQGIDMYTDRLKHYIPFKMEVVADVKKTKAMTEAAQKEAEGKMLLAGLQGGDVLVLLDEHGRMLTSPQMAEAMQRRMASGIKRLIFAVGGPYGFSPEVYARANAKLSLSAMTFPHELVRVFFIEQLYRAMTILRGEPYHHI